MKVNEVGQQRSFKTTFCRQCSAARTTSIAMCLSQCSHSDQLKFQLACGERGTRLELFVPDFAHDRCMSLSENALKGLRCSERFYAGGQFLPPAQKDRCKHTLTATTVLPNGPEHSSANETSLSCKSPLHLPSVGGTQKPCTCDCKIKI